jgi:Domain of unknown function (DUF4160)
MPEISRFLGIVVYMYFNEHNPPHFHVEYGEHNASILIDSLGVMQGKLPSRVLSLVVEWASSHQDELTTNWNEMRTTGQFKKILPLV